VSPTLTLASTSTYRQILFEKLGIPFRTQAPGVDEAALPNEPDALLAARLAREKALAVAARSPGSLVIGSDQVASLDGIQLAKPLTRDRAIAQLSASSGKTVLFHTAVCLVEADTGIVREDIDLCRVVFRPLTPSQIKRYVEREHVLDCAGSFKSEGLGISLIEKIVGDDPNALIGLPLIKLSRLLATFGFDIP
jgi:septum formation protein